MDLYEETAALLKAERDTDGAAYTAITMRHVMGEPPLPTDAADLAALLGKYRLSLSEAVKDRDDVAGRYSVRGGNPNLLARRLLTHVGG